MNALLDMHCGASPAQGKRAVVFVLSEALEPSDSWVVSDAACNALCVPSCEYVALRRSFARVLITNARHLKRLAGTRASCSA